MNEDATQKAWAEVEARGLDPKQSRQYRGRILTTVRCLPKGHRLAIVYPTAHGPLLVPTRSALPASRSNHKPLSVQRREAGELRKLFGGRAGDQMQADLVRDPWVETMPADDPELDPDRRFIRGLALVKMQDDAAEAAWLNSKQLDPAQRAYSLLCGCGERRLYVIALRDAIRSDVRRVTC